MRALLVGVPDYDDSAGIADLKGPVNDVRLMRRVLSEPGVSDIAILADGLEGSPRPTRAAILDGFRGLADRAGPGDLVYTHLSGH